MKNFQSYVGEESKQYTGICSRELLEKFQRTVRSPSVPPTFWTRCRKGEFELLARMGVELKQVLHAEQEYEFHESPRAEASYSYAARLSRVLEKKSKGLILHFFTFETRISREGRADPVAVTRSGIVFREKETEQMTESGAGESQTSGEMR